VKLGRLTQPMGTWSQSLNRHSDGLWAVFLTLNNEKSLAAWWPYGNRTRIQPGYCQDVAGSEDFSMRREASTAEACAYRYTMLARRAPRHLPELHDSNEEFPTT